MADMLYINHRCCAVLVVWDTTSTTYSHLLTIARECSRHGPRRVEYIGVATCRARATKLTPPPKLDSACRCTFKANWCSSGPFLGESLHSYYTTYTLALKYWAVYVRCSRRGTAVALCNVESSTVANLPIENTPKGNETTLQVALAGQRPLERFL